MVNVHQIFAQNELRNIMYVIEYNNNKAICIDPTRADMLLKFLKEKNLQVTHVINTHEHFDHTAGNSDIVENFSCEVLAHERAKERIPKLSRTLKRDDILNLDENSYLKVIDIPGHTYAHIGLLLFEKAKCTAVFTGDTLFNAGVGNCHSGDVNTLFNTINDIFTKLEDDVSVYPGHDYYENNIAFTKQYEPSNKSADTILKEYRKMLEEGKIRVADMGDERKINTFLRLNSNSLKENLMLEFSDETSKWTPKEVFVKLRELRDSW